MQQTQKTNDKSMINDNFFYPEKNLNQIFQLQLPQSIFQYINNISADVLNHSKNLERK